MTLTMREKEELLAQYHSLIWEVVYRFKKRYGSGWQTDDQDLYQEAVLAFFSHMEKQSASCDLSARFPFQQILHALCQYTLVNQVVSVPNTRTSDYKRRVSSMPVTVDYQAVDLFHSACRTTDEVDEKICFDQFVGTLCAVDQKIVGMKANNMRNCEVAKSLGLTDSCISRHLNRMSKKYHVS